MLNFFKIFFIYTFLFFKFYKILKDFCFSSEENTKIDLLDSAEVVSRKIDMASCPKKGEKDESGGEAENGILAFYKVVVLPVLALRRANGGEDALFLMTIDNKVFNTFDEIFEAFNSGKLTEKMLKDYLKNFLNEVLDKVFRACFVLLGAEII